jgi:iron(III) transport system permease protein
VTGRAIGVLLLLPLAGFAAQAAAGIGGFDGSLRPWGNSILCGSVATAVSLLLGAPAGLALARARGAWPFVLTFLPLVLPPALAAAAWMGLRLPAPGPAACGLILAAVTWPVVPLLLAAALRSVPAGPLEAAALQLPPGRAFRVAVRPHARPALAAGAVLVFLLAVSDFTVPATFAVTTASTAIYTQLSQFRFGAAAATALPLAALAAGAAVLLRRLPLFPADGPSCPLPVPRICRLALGLGWLGVLGPAALFAAGGLRALPDALVLFGPSIAWSAGVALLVAALLVAWSASSRGRSRMEAAWLVSLVLPGTATALGVLLVGGPFPGALPAALAARYAAVAWIALRGIPDPAQLDAAALAGLSGWKTWRRVVWPAVLPRALAAGAVVFALSMGELGASVLLDPPGRQSAVQQLFNLMHYGYDGTVAALALLLFAAAALIVGTGFHAGRLRRA